MELISREDLIYAIDKTAELCSRPKGKWIVEKPDTVNKCSVCGEIYCFLPQKINYCPNCGAEMESE